MKNKYQNLTKNVTGGFDFESQKHYQNYINDLEKQTDAKKQKMITLEIKFFTNGILGGKKGNWGPLIPKNMWDKGMVYLRTNELHGIKRQKRGVPFNSMNELADSVKSALANHDIVVHTKTAEQKRIEHLEIENNLLKMQLNAQKEHLDKVNSDEYQQRQYDIARNQT